MTHQTRSDLTDSECIRTYFTIPAALWMTSNRMPRNDRRRARIVRDLHAIAKTATGSLDPVAVPVRVDWCIQYGKGTGRADASNAQPTCKALLDGVVKAGLLADDDSKHVASETFRRGPNLPVKGHQITLTLKEDQ